MRPPNLHHIRQFNDRAKQVQGLGGKQIVENELMRGVQAEMLDVMCYVTELENRIDQLEQEKKEAANITVQMIGSDF